METAIPPHQLLQLLQQAIGTKVELVKQKIANQQNDYLVLIAQLLHPSLNIVIKIAGPDSLMAGSFDRTVRLHQLVASSTTIPLPEILAVDMSYQIWPWRYLIMTYIPGQEWAAVRLDMSSAGLSSAYQQIGNAVAQLHSIHFPEFGELAVDGSVLGGKSYYTQLIERARSSIKNTRLCDLYLSLLDKNQSLFTDVNQASLCHEDLHQHNILFEYRLEQWHLATILDFDKAWAGHHEIDLARLEFWRGMTSSDFWKAYTANGSIDPNTNNAGQYTNCCGVLSMPDELLNISRLPGNCAKN